MTPNVYKAGVWSAAPTPFTENGKIDRDAIKRLTEHHIRLNVQGVFVCGSSGEGPWITTAMCREVAEATVKAANGRLKVAVQVTDNSSIKILDNITKFVDSGVDLVVTAAPFMQMHETQEYLKEMFNEVFDKSPIPVGIYHMGSHAKTFIEDETIIEFMKHPNVTMIKDSTADQETMGKIVDYASALDNPPLLMNGNEFDTVPYLKAGYDGVLYGGACFNGYMSSQILKAAREGDFARAQKMQDRMSKMMLEIFGGEGYPCWLAAQKQVLVELGVFSTNKTIINYSLTPECYKALKIAIEREKKYLLP